jgi:hypothetical protein
MSRSHIAVSVPCRNTPACPTPHTSRSRCCRDSPSIHLRPGQRSTEPDASGSAAQHGQSLCTPYTSTLPRVLNRPGSRRRGRPRAIPAGDLAFGVQKLCFWPRAEPVRAAGDRGDPSTTASMARAGHTPTHIFPFSMRTNPRSGMPPSPGCISPDVAGCRQEAAMHGVWRLHRRTPCIAEPTERALPRTAGCTPIAGRA